MLRLVRDLNKVCSACANQQSFSACPSPGVESERADLLLTTRSWCNYNTNCPRHHLLLSSWVSVSQPVPAVQLCNSDPVLLSSSVESTGSLHLFRTNVWCGLGDLIVHFSRSFFSKVMLSQWGMVGIFFSFLGFTQRSSIGQVTSMEN